MAKKVIRLDQFKKQLEEIDISNLQEIEVAQGQSVFIRLGNSINDDSDDAQEFQDRLRYSGTSKNAALEILGHYPHASAEEQWALWEAAGGTADELMLIFTTETAAQQERLGKLRPRKS